MIKLNIQEGRELCVKALDLLTKIESFEIHYSNLLYRIQIEDLKQETQKYLLAPRSEFVKEKDESFLKMIEFVNEYNKLIETWPKI